MDTDVQQMLLVKQEAPEDKSVVVDQQDPKHLHIKEEQEEPWTSLEGEQLHLKKETDTARILVTKVSIKTEDDEEKPPSSQLHYQQQMKNRDVPTSSSADQMTAETGRGVKTRKKPELKHHEHSSSSSETEDSEDDKEEDEDVNLDSELSDTGSETGDDDWNERSVPGTNKRHASDVWEHFDLVSSKKVRCLLCSKHLSHGNNTSSMWRHLRSSVHANDTTLPGNVPAPENAQGEDVFRQKRVYGALVDMIVKDAQPFSIVEDEGFKAFVSVLDPSIVLPSRKALKTTVETRFTTEKEQAKAEVAKAAAVSLTTDMWTSVNMDTYLAVTCHYINEDTKMSTVLLGAPKISTSHTAADLAEAMEAHMAEWGIRDKVVGIVTDGAANMIASANLLNLRQVPCFAHMLNLVVKQSLSEIPELEDIRTRARRTVTLFKSSCTAKKQLAHIQMKMGMPELKLVQEVETRWNSTFAMLQRLYDLREPLGAALAGLQTDIVPFASDEYVLINDCNAVLKPIHQATLELSEDKRLSCSKVIPLIRMLKYNMATKCSQSMHPVAKSLAHQLHGNLKQRFGQVESLPAFSLPTLMDPRFKDKTFCSATTAQEATRRLTRECFNMVEATTSDSTQSAAEPGGSAENVDDLWGLHDQEIGQQQVTSATASATVEVQRYLKGKRLPRSEDPLTYWANHKDMFPHLYKLAKHYMCTPASSVPCERIFSKAGDVVNRRRSRLKPNIVEKIRFLNKNL